MDDAQNSGSMSAIGTESIISGLDPFVSYSVQMSARNDRGLGIGSSIMNQVSGQDSKYIYYLTCIGLNIIDRFPGGPMGAWSPTFQDKS